IRILAVGQGVERAKAPAAGFSRQLGCTQDMGAGGLGKEISRWQRALRRPADSPAIEEIGLAPVEAPEVVGPAEAEVEDVGPLDEEGTQLGVEGLDIAQVDHGRVHLDLAEVRVD